ncbi:MAG TPA: ATP-binding cassette domain-containing protein, partial [Ktedonobacteraceae bacterium]|nr:ATP-binding cassette domain-containing protein [Ktedonobacteraceae bacterium]
MLQINHLQLSYGPRVVLDDVSFTVAPGEKAGLIGVNGAGKSSLLKIIVGIQEPDSGNVMLPRSYGYLSQDVAHEAPVEEGMTVRDYIYNSVGLDEAIASFESLSMQLSDAAGDELASLLSRFEHAQESLDRLGYYDAEARSERLIAGLNLGGVTLDRQVSTLSGGQKTKLALARLLFQSPDVLLLDE